MDIDIANPTIAMAKAVVIKEGMCFDDGTIGCGKL